MKKTTKVQEPTPPPEQNSIPPVTPSTPPTPAASASKSYRAAMWVVKIAVALFSLFFSIQFVYETKRWDNGPATYLASGVKHFLNACERAGRFVAWLSSYLDWVELQAFLNTCEHTFVPLLELPLGGLRFAKGYVLSAYEYDHRLSIFVGTLLPLIAIEEYLRRRTTFFGRAYRWIASRKISIPFPSPSTPMGTFIISLVICSVFTVAVIFYNSPLGYRLIFAVDPEIYPYFSNKI